MGDSSAPRRAWMPRSALSRGSLSIGTGCRSDQSPEHLAEVTLTAKAHLLADFREGKLFVHEQILRFCDAETRQIVAKGLTDRKFEKFHEMRAAHSTDLRGVSYLNRLCETLLQKFKYRLQSL